MEAAAAHAFSRCQRRMFWLSWGTYASFYLLRLNISAAAPEIMLDLSLSRTEMGWIFSSQFFLYALGQFVNGQLGDWVQARRLVTLGLAASACINIVFGLWAASLMSMMLLWAFNGWFQSMGWGPIVKAMSHWYQGPRRTLVAGRLATSYILGGVAALALAGTLLKLGSWRLLFWVPALLCLLIARYWYHSARDRPQDAGFRQPPGRSRPGVRDHLALTLRITLLRPVVWLAALGLFSLNVIRYGFLDWAPTFFVERYQSSSALAAYESLAFPLAGALGAVVTGWLASRAGPRGQALVAAAMLAALAVLCGIFPWASGFGPVLAFSLLLAIGFAAFGPHMLLVTALPPQLGSEEAASSVTGFIDAVGYLGAGLTGFASGFLIDHYSWSAAFLFWITSALGGIAVLVLLWYQEKNAEIPAP